MIEENKSTVELEKETNISRQKLNQWRNFYYRLINAIRETFSKIVKIKIFFNSQKRVKVYHNYKTRFLIQITT